MMSKMQKGWLWIFGAMFVVPEILWSPIINLYYEFYQSGYSGNVQPFRNNFLQNSDNLNYLKLVICLEFIGITLFFISWITNKKNIDSNTVFWSVALVSFIIILISFLASSFVITFNPSFVL